MGGSGPPPAGHVHPGERLGRLSDARVLVATLAAAFNLRIGISVVGPAIESIRLDIGMSSGLAGALTMIPFTCMGLFAFLGPPLVRRWGSATVVILALTLIAAGSAARAGAEQPWLLLACTVPIGLGVALIGVTLPVVVKERFPARAGAVTGAYVASLSIGIAAVGFGLVPLVERLGGWRPAFLVTAIPALAAAMLWLGADSGSARPGARVAASPRGLPGEITVVAARSIRGRLPGRTAVLLGVVFGLQSMCFAGMVSWGPTIYEEAGWSPGMAAWTTSSIGVGTIISALIFPPLTDGRDRRPWIAAVAIVMGLGLVGVGVATTEAAWLWLSMFGLGSGATLPLLLAFPLDLHREPIRVGQLTAWMLGLGYLIAGLGPVLIGALRDVLGGLEAPMALLGLCGVAAGFLVMLAPKPTLQRTEVV